MGRYVFKLPDVGEGTAEAEIVAWHVAVGDHIREDQQLVDVMTDKATVEMTSPVDGIVIVSSPQLLATMVVKKCINMVQQLKGVIVGVVENMSYFETPDGERYEIFGPSNGTDLVGLTGAPLLGHMPIDSSLTSLCDSGRVEEYFAEPYEELANNFISTLKIKR